MKAHAIPTLQTGLLCLRALALGLAMSIIPVQVAWGDSATGGGQERHSPTGTWLSTVVRPAPLSPLLSMETYFADGNSLEESNSTAIRSLAHGSWEPNGKGQFTRSSLNFTFDASRNFVGSTQRVQTFQLSRDGQTLELIEGIAYRFDASGVLVSTTPDVPGSVTARRLFNEE